MVGLASWLLIVSTRSSRATSHDHAASAISHHVQCMDCHLMNKGIVVQVNVSPSGVPKLPVSEAYVGALGLDGDRQAHREIHGGEDRAVCLFAVERIEAMAA